MKREHSIHVGNINKRVYRREDRSYYWQHCRKEAEDDVFVDADGLQLDLLGDPVLSKEFIMNAIM